MPPPSRSTRLTVASCRPTATCSSLSPATVSAAAWARRSNGPSPPAFRCFTCIPEANRLANGSRSPGGGDEVVQPHRSGLLVRRGERVGAFPPTRPDRRARHRSARTARFDPDVARHQSCLERCERGTSQRHLALARLGESELRQAFSHPLPFALLPYRVLDELAGSLGFSLESTQTWPELSGPERNALLIAAEESAWGPEAGWNSTLRHVAHLSGCSLDALASAIPPTQRKLAIRSRRRCRLRPSRSPAIRPDTTSAFTRRGEHRTDIALLVHGQRVVVPASVDTDTRTALVLTDLAAAPIQARPVSYPGRR